MTEARNIQRTSIGIIILAAGESRRMKQPKQLLKFKGKTLLRNAAEIALASNGEKVCVVLGANFEKLKAEISALPVEIAVNENWQAGMRSSLKAGLEKLLEGEPDLAAVLVTLCDQPLTDANLLNRLINDFQKRNSLITACEYAGTVGVPAVFSRELFYEIQSLENEGGAKSLIKKYRDSVGKIAAPEAAFDIDTPEDYEKLINKIQ